LNLHKVGLMCHDVDLRANLQRLEFKLKTTTTAQSLQVSLDLKNFTEALAVFVQYNRDLKASRHNEQLDKRLIDSS
jgi:hypothetical protein